MKNLIFDLGFYNGADTENYLKKGFRVVAVEADPDLYILGMEKFSKEIESGELILLNRIFSDSSLTIQFYIHPEHKDWSTADKSKADYWGINYKTIKVEVITYRDLLLGYGIPYYIKCDIEGLDYLLIDQINNSIIKPKYVSCELSRLDYYKTFSLLYVSGYTAFQLRNQLNNPEYESGNFGEFLPEDEWLNFDTCLTRYMKYKELKAIDTKNCALGWLDIHCKMRLTNG
jgi:FkbM family methyltransferase